MKDGPNIAKIAALLGDAGRTDALCALLADRALTASELASIAGVTKQTMSARMHRSSWWISRAVTGISGWPTKMSQDCSNH
jgi:DNA-binding transcriptional ArsR family regulator